MQDSDERKLSSGRVQDALLAGVEKRALVWMAKRLPRWVGPDALTFVGLIGLVFVGAAYALAARNPLWLIGASAGLVVNWFGDSLDGTVARVRNQQRPKYGYYFDHLVDAVGTSCLMFGLAYSGLMYPMLAMVILALYMIMSINTYLAAQTVGEFRISYARLSPTEGRALLIILNTVLIFRQKIPILSHSVRIMDIVGVVVVAVLAALLLLSAVPNLRKLDRAERKAWGQKKWD